MSYCRFSSDDYKSDIYVYENMQNKFSIHLAGNRIIEEVPKIPAWGTTTEKEFFEAQKKQSDFMLNTTHEKIELDGAGDSFEVDTPGECAEMLIMFRDRGFHIPLGVIETLLEEQKEAEDIKKINKK